MNIVFKLQAASFKPQAASFKLQATSYKLQASSNEYKKNPHLSTQSACTELVEV